MAALMESKSETVRDDTEVTESRLRATQDELVAALRERVYVTFTGLAVLLTFEVASADASVWSVASTLLIGIVGAAFAGFVSDVISRLSAGVLAHSLGCIAYLAVRRSSLNRVRMPRE